MALGYLTEQFSRPKLLIEDGKRLISQEDWQVERALYDAQNTNTVIATEPVSGRRGGVLAWNQRYLSRMLPHAVGWIPMSGAWALIIVHLQWAQNDLSKIAEIAIPAFVIAAIYGTVAIFFSFALVQIVYQALKPRRYWESDAWYCALSLTAKLYLGSILLVNVIGVDGTVESALVAQ